MPVWLVENPTPVYVILGLAAIVLAYVWWARQENKVLIAVAVVIGLMVLVKLLDVLIVTDQEQVVLAVQDMAGSVQKKDVNRIFGLISEKFHAFGIDKAGFRKWVERRIHDADVTGLKVWDFEPTKEAPQPNQRSILFLVKAEGHEQAGRTFFRCKATFVRDADGQWRLSGCELMSPLLDPEKAEKLSLPLH